MAGTASSSARRAQRSPSPADAHQAVTEGRYNTLGRGWVGGYVRERGGGEWCVRGSPLRAARQIAGKLGASKRMNEKIKKIGNLEKDSHQDLTLKVGA